MKGLTITLIVLALLGLLVVTNPTSDDYAAFLQQEFVQDANAESELSSALANTFGGVASSLLASVTARKNYVLFSTYSAGSGDTERLTLGILGNFVTLKDGE